MQRNHRNQLKWLAHGFAFMPLLWLVYLIVTDQLGADPAEKVVRDLGFAGACLLWLSLAMTPARKITGWPSWIAFRRMLGLWSFAYICLHLSAFIAFWAGFDIVVIQEEISERPYILVGMLAWLLMIPLAITSTQKLRKRLGRRWATLHKIVYLVAVLALLHIIWFSKLDYLQPSVFGGLLLLSFLLRLKKSKK